MSRLRYNGLKGTLGASLTSSATSVTFAAALTHSHGTAVPTIVAPDYIPLTILDSTGNLSETVWLTAYTSGATSGTIIRGREGTTGVSHASGDAFVHAPLASDIRLDAVIVDYTTMYTNSGTSQSFTVPSTAAVDDLLVVFIGSSFNISVAPSGWRRITPNWNNTFFNVNVFVKECVSADIGATVSFTLGGSEYTNAYCVAVRNPKRIKYAYSIDRVFAATKATIQPHPLGSAAAGVALAPVTERGDLILIFGASRVTGGASSFDHGTVVVTRTGDANTVSALYSEVATGPVGPDLYTYTPASGNGAVAAIVIVSGSVN